MDGVDAVLADIGHQAPRVLAHHHQALPPPLREALLELNTRGADELHRAALAANSLARVYADAAHATLAAAGVSPADVRALGAHGQTVRHRPGEFDGTGYTTQLLNGALLAELSGINTICDFRSRDLAAGGQGAPLVPAFHAACLALGDRDVAVLNLGGIANLSLLTRGQPVRGFDCGPGNVLMDTWCAQQLGQPFDAGGAWAASAMEDATWLAVLLAEPFFQLPPPKSTGRDLFNARWLQDRLPPYAATTPARVIATLAALTAESAGRALMQHAPGTTWLWVCGGGAYNTALMARLQAALPGVRVQSTAAAGWPPEQVESAAFAWLAAAFMARAPGNRPEVTGARGPRVLGALYPAG